MNKIPERELSNEQKALIREIKLMISLSLNDFDENAPELLENDTFDKLAYLLDNEAPPVRAEALVNLREIISSKNKELFTIQQLSELKELLLKNIQHEESFVYLNAIKTYSAFVDALGESALSDLTSIYGDNSKSLELRLRIGEVISSLVRIKGEALVINGKAYL